MTLVLEVAAGLVLGGAFIWLFVHVGTRLSDRRRQAVISTTLARREIRDIQRRTLRQLMDIAERRDRAAIVRRRRDPTSRRRW
jgi:hypothetical protein